MGYYLLAAVAAAGFVASVVCHLMGWLHIDPPWGRAIFIMHFGIFVVGIPLVISANRTMPRPGRGNLEHLLAELPKWARVVTYALVIYALLNLVYFVLFSRLYPGGDVPGSAVVQFFSAGWMFFYGVASLGFVALARLARKRSENGLAAEPNAPPNGGPAARL